MVGEDAKGLVGGFRGGLCARAKEGRPDVGCFVVGVGEE